MDSKVPKSLMLILVQFLQITVCENAAFESNTDLENEIPYALGQYLNDVISDLKGYYERRVDQLQSDLTIHRYTNIKALHRHTSDAKDELIRNLQHKVNNQRMQIKRLQIKQRTYRYVIGQMEERLSNLERKSDWINTDKVESVCKENQELNMTRQQLNRNTKSRGLQHDTAKQVNIDRKSMDDARVAFFAQMTSHSTNLASHQIVVFDHVVTNIGNAYNEHSGTFIAPLSGTYVFSVTLGHYKNGALSPSGHGMVMVNGKVVAWLYMLEEQSSQTILVHLTAGNDVVVQNLLAGQGIYGDLYSTFSGFLLYDEHPPKSIDG